mmetsp:Transcript_2634/g.7135  ORF Transcript_2634/g.7135 Transcript_2634/m.7135 type:complete len:95 (-) Transcript_2634:16-300(-)
MTRQMRLQQQQQQQQEQSGQMVDVFRWEIRGFSKLVAPAPASNNAEGTVAGEFGIGVDVPLLVAPLVVTNEAPPPPPPPPLPPPLLRRYRGPTG